LLRSRYVGATTDLSWFDAVRDRLFRRPQNSNRWRCPHRRLSFRPDRRRTQSWRPLPNDPEQFGMIEECLELTFGRSGGKETTRMYEACLNRQLAAQR
jgi:hypothetical protein